jgi:hypothetical protein
VGEKLKLSHYSTCRFQGRRRISSSFLTSAPDGVSSQCHALAILYPQGKDPQIRDKAGWASLGLNTESRQKILYLCHGSNHRWENNIKIDLRKML